MNTQNTNDKDFERDVLKSSIPTLVDFWAEWCGPCKLIAPILEEIANEKKDILNIVKLDVDSNRQTAEIYNVMGIPTLILFKNGKKIDSTVGASMSKDQLINWIDNCLLK